MTCCIERIIAAAVALSAGPAFAASASLSYPPEAAALYGPATKLASAVYLPSTGTSGIDLKLVLPLDYDNGKKVEIVLLLTKHGAPPCTARIVPRALIQYRAGQGPVGDSLGLLGGNPIVDFPAGDTVVKKVFAIVRGTAPKRRGDALKVGIGRQGDDPADTCGTVLVHSIEVRYPLAP